MYAHIHNDRQRFQRDFWFDARVIDQVKEAPAHCHQRHVPLTTTLVLTSS